MKLLRKPNARGLTLLQTVNNACASVALLNIVNNVPDLELGEHLCAFREFTMTFSPAIRGDAVKNYNYVRSIHNNFARCVPSPV